jgi:hypothetical protein
MATKSTVNVKNIAPQTSDESLREFFSFCGNITNINVTTEGETKNADVTFEKATAAKTALLLNNTQLGPNHITVSSADADSDDDAHYTKNADRDSDQITQEDKPRARILAEYLSQGYVVGDVAIQRAIELDSKHGVSSRFFSTLQQLDSKYHATDRAKATDESYGITQRAAGFLNSLGSYFENVTNTPTGKKIVQFYTDGTKQVQEVHAEARRLADAKTDEHGSAYKAPGLEKVFGKEKEQPNAAGAAAASQADGAAPSTMGSTPIVPSDSVPVNEKSG